MAGHTAAIMQAEGALVAERGGTNGLLANPAGATPEAWAQARAHRTRGEALVEGVAGAARAMAQDDATVREALARHGAAAEQVAALRVCVEAELPAGVRDVRLRLEGEEPIACEVLGTRPEGLALRFQALDAAQNAAIAKLINRFGGEAPRAAA